MKLDRGPSHSTTSQSENLAAFVPNCRASSPLTCASWHWAQVAVALGFGLATSLGAGAAEACGGLFCSNSNPVNQAAERIVFAQNDDDTITAVIEIQYEGPAHEFAWVLPLPKGHVDVDVSSKLALDRLQQRSNPQYNLQPVFCPNVSGDSATIAVANAAAGPVTPGGGVVVISEGTAGPYDYKLIEVDPDLDDPADAAVNWLDDNGFDVASVGPDLLRPYLEQGHNLLAFRLSKGNDTGSIRPVMINYEGTVPSIPIIPTAVAAKDDMGVMVWILGPARAVPTNYLHLELNEALIDWFNPTRNYDDVVSAAADDAGGQGFVTEQASATGLFAQTIFSSVEEQNFQNLKTGTYATLDQFFQTAVNSFAGYDGMLDVLSDPEVLPLREGATPEQFMGCVSCYFQVNVPVRNQAYPSTEYDPQTDPINDTNVLAFLQAMDDKVVGPMRETAELFEKHDKVTRLYTTLSADEMTVDPVFEFNESLPDYSNVHTAQQVTSCDGSDWRVVLPQGVTVRGTGSTWPVSPAETSVPANFRIVQMGTSGNGEEVEDNGEVIASALEELGVGGVSTEEDMAMVSGSTPTADPDESPERRSSGGCNFPAQRQGGTTGLVVMMAAIALSLHRRKR